MIIQGLQAENLFKYARISIAGLEQKGRILISGSNESGKTTIAEAICLGLFGRTVAHEASQLAKAVKWGEESASVTVTFLGKNNQSYSVYRYFDNEGQSQASLSVVGEDEHVAKGVKAVNSAITSLLGYGFQHYIDTLFLAQTMSDGSAKDQTIKSLAGVADLDELASQLIAESNANQEEITAGEAEYISIRDQIATLNIQEGVLTGFESERAKSSERVSELESNMNRWKDFTAEMQESAQNIETATQRLSQCDINSSLDSWQGRAKPLEQALNGIDDVCQKNQVEMENMPGEQLRGWVIDLQKRLSVIKPIMKTIEQDRHTSAVWLGDISGGGNSATMAAETADMDEALVKYRKRSKGNSRWGLFTLLMAIVIGGAGGVLQFLPDVPYSQTLAGLLQGQIPIWDPSMIIYLLAAGGLFFLMAMVSFKRSYSFGNQAANYQQQLDKVQLRADAVRNMVKTIDSAANESLARQIEILSQLQQPAWAAELKQWGNNSGSVFLQDSNVKKFLGQQQAALDSFRKHLSSYNTDIAEQLETFRSEQAEHTDKIAQLDDQIANEKTRRTKDQTLRRKMAELESGRTQLIHGIEVRRVAHDLLKGTCKGLSARFNQELRRFIAKATPLFTQGRYQHLRIDEELNVAAFSTFKNDFVDFNEISTGVRYQLLLSVRMALAQALVARSDSAPQFVVLDEPFVFFDRQRVRDSLNALLKVSEQINQVWIITQEDELHEEDALTTDLHLNCTLEEDSLLVY